MTIEPEDPSLQGQRNPQDSTTDTRPEQRSPSVIRRHGGRVVEIRLDDDTVDERASPDLQRVWVEDDFATTRDYVAKLDAKTRHLDAQTRAREVRNHGREVTGHTVVRIIVAVIAAASLVAWLWVVLSGGDATAVTAVSAVALVATNFATNVLTKSRDDKDKSGDDGDDA